METVDFSRLGLRPGERVLDLGCGEGRHTLGVWLSADVVSVGVDLSLQDLQTAQKKATDFIVPGQNDQRLLLACANGLHLPFADASFDKVICSEVLEHIPDYQGVLREILRVLKPGGDFVASVPRTWPERICWWLCPDYARDPGGHIRIFKARALRREIELLDLRFTERHWAHALHTPYWWLKCVFRQRGWSERHWLVAQYHRLLVWDLMERPWLTRALEWLLNPLMGKSVVMYFRKGAAP